MPDPTAHSDDMKSLAQPETMPSLWWLEPWTFAVQQWNARAKFYADWKTADEKRYNASTALCHIEKKLKEYDKAIMETANEAGFQASKFCYAINGQPTSPFPLTWLGETVAYWKGEAYSARLERDEAKASLAVMTEDRDAYISKVQELREEQQGLLHEARVAIANNETNEGNIDNLEARLEGKQSFINQALKDLEACQDRIAELEGKKKPKAKRKPAKKKAKPLWENKTAGVSFTLGNHEDRHDPIREAYASLGRKFIKAGIKAQAKAKKKGGAK
jgi:hypothetical protein